MGEIPLGRNSSFPSSFPSNACHAGYVLFSSPESPPFLFRTKNRDLWLGPVFWACAEFSFHISHLRCWTSPDVAILGADQKERGHWRREWLRVNLRKQTYFRLSLVYAEKLNKQATSLFLRSLRFPKLQIFIEIFSPKFTERSMKTPCWCTSVVHGTGR